MKRKLLTMMAAFAAMLAVPIGAGAQTDKGWTTGATVGDGDFYLYNTGTKQYLAAGYSNWGTEAWSMPHARKVTLTTNGSGYNIDTQISNGGSSNYLATTWLDGNATAWTFTPTTTEGITNGYTLNNGTADLSAPNANTALANSTDATTNNEWLLITADMIKEAMNTLTYDGTTYVDATPFIICPDIIRNDLVKFADSWTFSKTGGTNNFAGSEKYNNGANLCGEVYNATFDLNQTLTGMPNGKYILRVQGFQRTDGSTKVAKLYANEAESNLMLLQEGSATSTNSMKEASEALANGDFSNNSVEVMVTDGTLKIGIKKENLVGNSDWVIFDNFSLEYYGADPSEIYTSALLYEKFEEAENLLNEKMSAAVEESLMQAEGDAEDLIYNSGDGTVDERKTVITALNTAIANAQADITAYAALNSALKTYGGNSYAYALDQTGRTTYNSGVADIQSAYDKGTYTAEEATAAVAKVVSAYIAAVKAAKSAEGANITDFITNPSFETGDTTGWEYFKGTDTGVKPNSNGNYTTKGIDGSYLFNTWSSSSQNFYVQQTVTLPAGVYTLSALVASDEGNTVSLSANNNSATVTTSTKATFDNATVTFVLTEETDVTIKVSSSSWFKADNFTLTYSSTLSDEMATELLNSVPTGTMNAEVETALNNAKTAFEGSKTPANYATLSEAITAANASITAYTTAANVLPKMKELTESTNFYTADALNTYYTQWQTKYDERTLTTDEANALQDPTEENYGARDSRGMSPKFLLGVWDDGGTAEDNAVTRGDYYINTWSGEGKTDGSNMTVPFFEYWTDNEFALTAKTLTGKMTGLTANQLYKVSALVRVQVQNSGSNGTGITMQVADGKAVDVCGGTASTSAGYYYGTYTATGKADADGNLTLKFIVADGNNISWLSFRNVKYEETNVDVTALNEAIAAANAVNAGVTNGVQSLTEAIATAKALLNSTSQDDIDAGVTALTTATEAAKAIVTARLRAAGEYKKYTALNSVINNTDQTEAIEALKTVAENAAATVDDVTTAEAKVNLLDNYQKLTIANNSFDNNPTIAADGTQTGTLSSLATEAKPYLYEVRDWTINSTFSSTASHGSTAVYGAASASTNGTNNTNAPATDMYGLSEGGVLHVSSGWDDIARYQQSVTLPAGQYVFYYEAYNANSAATTLSGNYCGINGLAAAPSKAKVTGNKEASINAEKGYVYENNKSFASGEWTANAMSFSLTQAEANAAVSIGVVGASNKSVYGAKLWIDNVEVYYIPATMETYTRTATSTGWGTICLPYAATPGDNVTVYEIDGVDNTEAPNYVIVSEATTMEAGKPYIYKAATEDAAVDAKFTQTNTTNVEAPVDGKNGLTGVFTSSVGLVANGSYILNGGLWYKVDNADAFNLGDNRAYIADMASLPAATSGAKSVKMTLNDGGTTGIKGIVDSINAAKNSTIYTLSGQRVSNTTKGNIYIVNGKKVLVK